MLLSDIDYKVTIARANQTVYETKPSHSLEGTAKVKYSFTSPGSYEIIVSVTGMNSKQISDNAPFFLNVGSSTVPEFGLFAPLVFVLAVSGIVASALKTRLLV